MTEQKLCYYDHLKHIDVITPIKPWLSQGVVGLGEDGSLDFLPKTVMDTENSWIHTKVAEDRNCALWTEVYFKMYRIISRNCFHCWKIVARPNTLTQLFAMEKLQNRLGFPAKCGIEQRPYAVFKGPYAAFWYCDMRGGQEGAKYFIKEIEKAVHKDVGKNIPVILKRACTEMENMAGRSSEWEFPEGQYMFEDLLDATWKVNPYSVEGTPTVLKASIHRSWIEQAVRYNDPELGKYIDNMEKTFNVVDTVTYHNKKVKLVCSPKITFLKGDKNAEQKTLIH